MQSGLVMPGGQGCRVPDMPVVRSPLSDRTVPGDVERPDGLPVGFEPRSRDIEPPVEPPGEVVPDVPPLLPDVPPVAPGDDPGDEPGDDPLPVCADAALTRSSDVAAIAMLAFQSMNDLLSSSNADEGARRMPAERAGRDRDIRRGARDARRAPVVKRSRRPSNGCAIDPDRRVASSGTAIAPRQRNHALTRWYAESRASA
jgi:hypothetical protein